MLKLSCGSAKTKLNGAQQWCSGIQFVDPTQRFRKLRFARLYRELAQQVADSCSSLRKLYKLRVACIVGGSDRAAQAQSLAGKPDIIVATPGRLIDLADSADSALSESPVCLSLCHHN